MYRTVTGVVLLAAGVLTAPVATAQENYTPELLHAVQRDLGLDAQQARARLRNDAKAADVAQRARTAAGDSYGGAWIQAGKLVVGITDTSKADVVRSQGAEVAVVRHAHSRLKAAKQQLDGTKAPASVAGWRVDERSNSVVVEVSRGARDAEEFIAAARRLSPSVTVEEVGEAPRLLHDVRGGDAIYNGGSPCSVGFSVEGGFVTAGHCGDKGDSVKGFNQVPMGSYAGSSFPTNDYAWVKTTADWTAKPWVNRQNGTNITVKGSTEVAVGAAVCRSGRTTGWHCGTVLAKDQTVNYGGGEGQVTGLTKSDACAESGDSGGSWVGGEGFTQAQGVLSGGSGTCRGGAATSFFQPLQEILSAYGLTLLVSK
ncbi:S1 family peptidase [Allokutzneria sp. A3M-2-11 16]|uniref:S1 family peptidase n=1 Tax=Allokutzneria sp. A3M-2-11 16 TaxID=2962043 RepID=UPI0020B7D6D5|nr:S1 family peptidase [Allokutzneria sp. A3M-2-11 16]MCP3802877.1 S1 family peptidase [Allokutzneria sp. A3M-2-11 16]